MTNETETTPPPEVVLTCSDQLDKLFEAMAKAQAEITDAEKDSTNPFFKSKYADLASVRAACVPAMAKNGLCVMQFPFAEGKSTIVVTILGHSSGQYIRAELTLTAKDDGAQSIGSAITYARRYSLMAVAGVAASEEDDDGNAAARPNRSHAKEPAAKPQPKSFTASRPAEESREWLKLKDELKAIGCREGHQDEADAVLKFVGEGKFTLLQCFRDAAVARDAIDAIDVAKAVMHMTNAEILDKAGLAAV
jgi:hypothetical protein